jgi:DSF synthase
MQDALKSNLALVDTAPPRHTQLNTYYDAKYRLMWSYMHATPRPCFTQALLQDLHDFRTEVTEEIDDPQGRDIRYLVLASDNPGVFNLGGDLDLLRRLVMTGQREALLDYAQSCVDLAFANTLHLGRDLTTIALVQGDALGGGFEAALSSNVLVAERSAKMGLPEILFNLFPGMGAYSFLSRRLGGPQAERMILSGRLYGAEELYEMGVVDVLAEDLQGEMAVYDYIKRENRSPNGYRALRAAKDCVHPVSYDELMNITEIWVEAALRLRPRDLRMMERLVTRQSAIPLQSGGPVRRHTAR